MENIGAPPALSTSDSFFAPLLVSMIGIFCTGLALVIYHFVLAKFCLRRPPQTINNSPIPEPDLAKGVDQKILEKIPIMAYSIHKLGLFRVDQNECAVCLGELEDDEMVRLLPNCRHAFHVPCIDEWFVAHTNCPICRSPVTETTTHIMYLLDSLPLSSPSVLNEESGVRRGDCSSTSSSSSSSSGIKLPQESHGMLRHCLSLVVPKERRSLSSQKKLGLRRSLSMDHSFIVTNREKEYEGGTLLRSKSMKNNDGVSSKLLRSLSRLRRGKGSQIIPY